MTAVTELERDPLDNPAWTALTSELADFAEGYRRARRFITSVSVFGAVADLGETSWADLASLTGPSHDVLLCHADPIEPPPGWEGLGQGLGHQMVLDQLPAVALLDGSIDPAGIRALGADDVDAMVELIALTEPGPFRRRTYELGGYLGIVDDGRLVAMAGQRLRTPTHTEISAVCTHPDARRRGYAAAITVAVARRIVADGRTPILHVAEHNDGARRVYESIGFRTRTMITFAAFRSPPAPNG